VQDDQLEQFGKYAYGFGDSRAGDRRIVGRNGGAPSMNGQLEIYLSEGYTIVVLSNLDPPAGGQVAEYFRDLLK
jgi:hypothetical protein